MIKRSRVVLYIINILYLISLFWGTDLFKENISGITIRPYGYLRVVIFALLYLMIVSNGLKIIGKYIYITEFSILMTCFMPYSQEGTLIATLHVIVAYLSFCILTISHLYAIYLLYFNDLKRSKKCFYLLFCVLLCTFILYLYFMGINGLMELIYLSGLIIISFIIETSCARISTL